MSNISYSTLGFVDRDVEAALDGVAAAGFTQTEIMGQAPHLAVPPKGKALADFRARLVARGLRARTVHAPLTRNVLGAPEEGWRLEVVEVLASYLRLAGELEATEVVIHPVPNPIFVPEGDHPEVAQRIADAVPRSLDRLVPIAGREGVRILLENLPYACGYPFLGMQELRPLVEHYPEEQLGLVIDTGHAWTMKRDPSREIEIAGSRLRGTHLQDVDYEDPNDNHWPPTQGGLDWSAIRNALASVGYPGPWTFEVARGTGGETPEQLARLTRQVARSWGL
jgi:sugar phosphate isomerase/epimerase